MKVVVSQANTNGLTAITQHLTTTNAPWLSSGNILLGVLTMFVVYIVIFVCFGSWAEGRYTPFARKIDRLIQFEIDAIERMGLWFNNHYWLVRCVFTKRWWQKRKLYNMTYGYGMSWEGKEKEYLNRYATSK